MERQGCRVKSTELDCVLRCGVCGVRWTSRGGKGTREIKGVVCRAKRSRRTWNSLTSTTTRSGRGARRSSYRIDWHCLDDESWRAIE
eukprot:2654131-Prymnesium_polylepis.1